MGLFFNTVKYSKEECQLSAEYIRRLVSINKVRSLDGKEERIVEEEIISRRRGDGKISLAQIYKVLTKLKNQNKISRFDRDSLMKVFADYFNK